MTWPARSPRRHQLPDDWPAIRKRILDRDEHRCTWTDQAHRCPAPATDIDHIGDPNNHTDTNLRSLCDQHHKQRTARQGVQARATKYDRRRPKPRHPGLT